MKKKNMYPLYFTYGALALYLVFVIAPGIGGLLYSFTDWSSYSTDISFVGFENFIKVFSTKGNYFKSIMNTVEFTILTTFFKTVIGFLLALALAEKIKGRTIHRTIIFIPALLSTLVTGILFRSILSPRSGLLNVFLGKIGLECLQMRWLTDTRIAFLSVIAVDVWKGVGYVMTILLAGLMTIPKDYYEAARIDGASYWKGVRHITIPLMMRAITITVVLNIIYGLRVFDIIVVLTNGGPAYKTSVVYTRVWELMRLGLFGQATAMSSVLFVVMALTGFFIVRFMGRSEVEL